MPLLYDIPMIEIHIRLRQDQLKWVNREVKERHLSVAYLLREALDKTIKEAQNKEEIHA